MPHRLLPRRIEAQFAPHAETERGAGFADAVNFPERAEWVRGELDHKGAEGVGEGAVREGAEIDGVQHLAPDSRQAFLFDRLQHAR